MTETRVEFGQAMQIRASMSRGDERVLEKQRCCGTLFIGNLMLALESAILGYLDQVPQFAVAQADRATATDFDASSNRMNSEQGKSN